MKLGILESGLLEFSLLETLLEILLKTLLKTLLENLLEIPLESLHRVGSVRRQCTIKMHIIYNGQFGTVR